MGYEEVFDGEEHWLGKDCWPGWQLPYLRVAEVVEMAGRRLDPLEGPDTNIVAVPAPDLELHWAIEEGWSVMSVMLQTLGTLLDGKLIAEQINVRDGKTFEYKSKHYRVQWKGEEVEGL